MSAAYAILAVYVAFCCIAALAILTAEYGWQDADGYHRGVPPGEAE